MPHSRQNCPVIQLVPDPGYLVKRQQQKREPLNWTDPSSLLLAFASFTAALEGDRERNLLLRTATVLGRDIGALSTQAP